MATFNQFDKYGLREIANVWFYALEDDPRLGVKKGEGVLYFDTLKTSTFEFTADQVDATGGRGAPKLVSWNSGKSITVALQDALMSAQYLALAAAAQVSDADVAKPVFIHQTELLVADNTGKLTLKYEPSAPAADMPLATVQDLTNGKNVVITTATGLEITDVSLADAQCVVGYYVKMDGSNGAAKLLVIDAEHFPGTYKIVGETLIRSEKTGKDYPYQFTINRAKINNEFTLSMAAEGDPSVFDMNVDVLRDGNRNMVEFVLYNLEEPTAPVGP